ncbi:Ig-like domain-containing protein, partial [Andreprevotia sp. IGB-42]|uniref:Ig-like domain-containing protein n=1 Tax=Andreprevotia sp. IGB-42 TaxID=2497473 RepID=UPI0013589C0C
SNYNGNDSFTVTVSDGKGGTDTVTVNVGVTPVNDAPVGANQSATTPVDTPVSGKAVATDVDGDALTFGKGSNPAHGSVVVDASGNWTYTPDAKYTGSDSFTVTVNDGNGGTTALTVNIGVNAVVPPVNHAPTANDDSTTVLQDGSVTVAVRGNDTDPDAGDTLTVSGVTQGANGSVVVDIATGNPIYTPNAGYTGSDQFTYTISDGHGGTATATVNVTVNALPPVNTAPTALDDSTSLTQDTSVTIAVRGNDTDADGDTLTVSTVTQGANGSVVIDAVTGNPVYTPNAGYTGNDQFTYTVSDGHGGTATATVSVTVNAVVPGNVAPVGISESVTTAEDKPISGTLTATDADGDALSFTKATDPAHGNVTVDAAGNWTYTPASNYNGADSFTVTVSDGKGGSDTITVSVGVTPVNDAPVAVADHFTTSEGTPVTIKFADLLGNDTDVDGDLLSVGSAQNIQHGTLSVVGGNLVFTPAANFSGTASFDYTVSDGHGGTNTATVSIDVTPVNDAPVFTDNNGPLGNSTSVTTPEDTPVSGTLTATDADGDALTFAKGADPVHGTVTVDANGNWTYTPANNYNGADSFTVTVSDGKGGTDTLVVNVGVTPVNDAPVGQDESISTHQDTPFNGTVTGSDVDGDKLTFAVAIGGDPAHGTVTVNPDGSYTYTPTAGFNGNDSFAVTVSDPDGATSTLTVSVNVGPNSNPVATATDATTPEDTAVTGKVTATDVDAGDVLTFKLASGGDAAHGTVSVAADGSWSYTPGANYNGKDSFQVTVEDGHGGSNTVTVNVDVTPVNDAPVLVDGNGDPLGNNQSVTTPEDTPV